MHYEIGTNLKIKNYEGTVRGYIEYQNLDDGKTWYEYRLIGPKGEWWLSIDTTYKEYSISYPANYVQGNIGPEWQKVDEGTLMVKSFKGDVDVDMYEKATFIEYEDDSKINILSAEIWEDGTEYSKGFYINPDEIHITGQEKVSKSFISNQNIIKYIVIGVIFIIFLSIIFSKSCNNIFSSSNNISNFLYNSNLFTHNTTIEGNENQKAEVYTYNTDNVSTDEVAEKIIDGIEGNTESVTQQDDQSNNTIAIVTESEYCLVYHPEDEPTKVLAQVSNRKYNYTSDQAPLRSSSITHNWYKAHYASSALNTDKNSFSSSPSAYSMYQGDTIHNIGNGYFDTYANNAKQKAQSIKQSSIGTRSASSGGISSGK